MPIRTLIGLILCNAIWAANPIMGKILLERFSSNEVAWLRYSSATFFYIALWLMASAGRLSGLLPRAPSSWFVRPRGARDSALVFGLGFSAFCFAPLVAFTGLKKTGAVDNAILIALEPVVTVLLAAVFLRERLDRTQIVSFLASLLGFGFLSGVVTQPASSWMQDPSILGNLILVVSLLGEGGYSIFASRLSGRYPMLPVFGSALLAGFSVLTLAVTALGGLPNLSVVGIKEALALFWLGPLGSTLTYLYWVLALSKTDVSSAALTLFVQPVVGAVLGVLVFSEAMGPAKLAGAALIFVAVGLLTRRRPKAE